MSAFQRVTLAHVAEIAGVSKQTVSRVVNDHPNVSPNTRERVLGIIAELGYRPSALARTLTQGRSFTLAVVCSNFGFLNTELYQGAAQEADALGYSLILKPLGKPRADKVEELFLSLMDMQVDGVLWAIPDVDDNFAWLAGGILQRISFPLIFMSTEPRQGIDTVSFDNHDGARLATRHLIAHGRRRIGHLSGPLGWWVARERVRGWRDALREAGLEAPERFVSPGDWSPLSGEKALAGLLDANPDLDAVFVANDRMALGALLTAHRRGIRIPEDLAIMGFDNIVESACFYPPLTTVLQDKQRHGELAVTILVRKVAERFGDLKGVPNTYIELGHEIVERDSVGTPVPQVRGT